MTETVAGEQRSDFGGRMVDRMQVNDAQLAALIERVNNAIDGQTEIKGQLATMVQMQLTLVSQQEQIRNLQAGQGRLFEKSDDLEEQIAPLRDDMIGNKRAIRVLGIIGTLIVGLSGTWYSQWKPWQADIQTAKQARDEQITKYSQDVGRELQSTDRRLTVLEFRANNIDQKASK